METNAENTKEIRISRPLSPAQIIIDQKQQNMEYFNYLSSMTTNDAKSTHEIKSGIDMTKAAFNKKNLHQHMGLKLNEETSKVITWSTDLYYVENSDTIDSRSEIPGTF
jgi:hypothetical protein